MLNWQALSTSKRIVLAEGVLDVLALWQAGVREATCLLGSAQLLPDLEELLARYAVREVVLCLDGDEAGQEGAQRLVQPLCQRGVTVHQVAFPADADPNEVLQQQGPEALHAMVAAARPLAEPSTV